MTWVILTGRQNDIDQFATRHKIISTRDYLTHPSLFRGARPKVINLSNNVGYQSRGYYASLLASSRGHRVIPTVETIIDLSEPKLYENALPELELGPPPPPERMLSKEPSTRKAIISPTPKTAIRTF